MSPSIAPSLPIPSPAIDPAIIAPASKSAAPSGATSTATWTPERIEQLRSCIGSGMTCSQIAAAIGVSRNAVIGKIHRLGL
jgi:GcrA cell cycle regulator